MKLGEYLISKGLTSREAVERGLLRQADLSAQGRYRPLGEILAGEGALDRKDLRLCLARSHREALAESDLFSKASPEDLELFAAASANQVQPEGSVVLRQGHSGDSLFFIVSGSVLAFADGADGCECPLRTFGPGEAFGVAGFFFASPSMVSFRTLSPASFLVFSRKQFSSVFESKPEILQGIIHTLSLRLGKEREDLLHRAENERAFHRFAAARTEIPFCPLVGNSVAFRKMKGRLRRASESSGPLLLHGPFGSRKPAYARAIHEGSSRAGGPLVFLDAARTAGEGGEGEGEMAQYAALFGCEQGALDREGAKLPGLLSLGRGGSVVINHVEKLSPFVQDALFEFMESGAFIPLGSREEQRSDARIMALTTFPQDRLAQSGLLSSRLLERLAGSAVDVPPLSKRKKDLGEIVEELIRNENAAGGKNVQGIAPQAYQRIMAYDWPGDMEELAVVVRRAVSLAESELLMPEDLFIGLAPPEGKYVVNLFRVPSVREMFRHRLFPLLPQALAGLFLALFVLVALLGKPDPEENFTATLAWAVLWPLTVLSWLLAARAWCGVCPMGAAGDLARRLAKPRRKLPAFLRDKGLYISSAGLLIIVWVEMATEMAFSPRGTAFLVLSITSLAVLFGLLYERRLWCRYLCPFGMLSAVFSCCSVMEWRANRSICNTTCGSPACFKGSDRVEGCPMFQGPFALNDNGHCILCGNCAKLCEHSSPTLRLRPPGHELWALVKPYIAFSVFVPAIVATQLFRMLDQGTRSVVSNLGGLPPWLALAALMLLLSFFSYLFVALFARILMGKGGADAAGRAVAATSLIPLCVGFELAFHFGPLLKRSGHILPELGRTFGFHLEFLDFTSALGAALPWQLLFLISGSAGSLYVLSRLVQKHCPAPAARMRLREILPIVLLFSLYASAFIAAAFS